MTVENLREAESEFRVPVHPVKARLLLGGGRSEDVTLFLGAQSRTRRGPESLDEFLNHPRMFLPVTSCAKGESVLINRLSILGVEVSADAPVLFRMEEIPAVHFDLVRIEMEDGNSLEGTLPSIVPSNKPRLSDYFNSESQCFIPLEVGGGVTYLNKHRLVVVWL